MSAPDRKTLAALVGLAAVGAAAVLVATSTFGPGTSPDSVTYLSTAGSLLSGDGFERFDGRLYVSWPPLYPLVLGLVMATGVVPLSAAAIVGAVALASTVVAVGLLVARATGQGRWGVVAALLVLASPCFLRVAAHAWAEALFSALVASTICVAASRDGRPSFRRWIVIGALAGATVTTRYVGVALWAAVLAWIWWLPGTWRRRLADSGTFLGVAAVPIGAWAARNLAVGRDPAGTRGATTKSIPQNIERLTESLGFQVGLPWSDTAATELVVVAGVGALLLWAVREARRSPGDRGSSALILGVGFFASYAAVVVAGASVTTVADLGLRFAAPLHVPWVIVAVVMVARAPRRLAIGLGAAVALSGFVGLVGTVDAVENSYRRGVGGLTRAHWHQSEIHTEASRLAGQGPVFSNRPHLLYLHTGLRADYAPRQHSWRSPERTYSKDVKRVAKKVKAAGGGSLVWYSANPAGYGYFEPGELEEMGLQTTLTAAVGEGAVYALMVP